MRNKRISLYKAKAYIHGWPSIVYGYSKDFAKNSGYTVTFVKYAGNFTEKHARLLVNSRSFGEFVK